jgi:hypothetical protein
MQPQKFWYYDLSECSCGSKFLLLTEAKVHQQNTKHKFVRRDKYTMPTTPEHTKWEMQHYATGR